MVCCESVLRSRDSLVLLQKYCRTIAASSKKNRKKLWYVLRVHLDPEIDSCCCRSIAEVLQLRQKKKELLCVKGELNPVDVPWC